MQAKIKFAGAAARTCMHLLFRHGEVRIVGPSLPKVKVGLAHEMPLRRRWRGNDPMALWLLV